MVAISWYRFGKYGTIRNQAEEGTAEEKRNMDT
jgi:hypothetical protein